VSGGAACRRRALAALAALQPAASVAKPPVQHPVSAFSAVSLPALLPDAGTARTWRA
jgi:hypothetical protein